MRKRISGYTLIELIVVILIIGILATISIATFRSFFKKARDAERQSAIQTVSNIVKVDGASDWKDSKYVYSVPALNFVFKINDYRPPKSKNNICYIFGSAREENSYIGDDNEFVFMTWGETTSTLYEKAPGVIVDGTEKGIRNVLMADLDIGDFECDKSTVLAEMAFETGLLGTPLYYLGINEEGDVFQWNESPAEPYPEPEPDTPIDCSSFSISKCWWNKSDCKWKDERTDRWGWGCERRSGNKKGQCMNK